MDYSKLPPNLLKELKTQGVKRKLEKVKNDLMGNIEGTFEKLDSLTQDLDCLDQPSPTEQSSRKKTGELSTKVYMARTSLLSDLLQVDHIKSIYNIFIAILIILFINTIITDIFDDNRSILEFELIKSSFGNLSIVITAWSCMFLSTSLLLYPIFHLWFNIRDPGTFGKKDIPWLMAYITYQLLFLFLPPYTTIVNNLPISSSFIVVTEQVRLFMKTHAFVREKIRNINTQDSSKEDCGSTDFTKFLYFLFAPTLVYRDKYPRNQGAIRWGYVVTNLLQVVGSVFYLYFIFERFCIPHFRDFHRHSTTPHYLLISIFSSVLPATLALFITFFAILHSWLNAFAEMLQFADRLFYKDWWNSHSFSIYYRTWNVVVHDWLYAYVYQDMYKLLGKSHRAIPMAMVFILSAVVHEYIISVVFGFVYPVLFVMFAGAGFALIFVPKKSHTAGNIFLWVSLFIGNGMLMCMYSMEWYARKRCPVNADSFIDLFIPRSWTCDYDRIHSSSSPPPPSSSSSPPPSSSFSSSSLPHLEF